jgi:hypothetical protein
MDSWRTKPELYSLPLLLFLVGSVLLVFYAALLVVQVGFLFIGNDLNDTGTLLAIAISLAYYWAVGKRVYRLSIPVLGIGFLAVIGLMALAILVAGYYIDLSWDGRDYQQRGVYKLLGGWNPVYTTLQPDSIYKNAWLNHYPKGPWIAAASIVRLTHNIESGKLFNLLLLVAVFLIALSYFLPKRQLKFWQVGLLGLYLAANPVSVYQSLSFYIDGQVSSMLILLILLMLLCLERVDLGRLITLVAAVVIGLNIKFTGAVYVVLLLVIFILASWYTKKDILPLLPIWSAILIGSLLGVLMVGYNPYLVNTFRYGHPFYPLYGGNRLNKDYILQGQIPSDYETMSWHEKLIQSIFSPSRNAIGVVSDPIKFPLSIKLSEVTAFALADVRVSGWGPLYGALLIISLAGLILLAFISRKAAVVSSSLVGLVIGTTLLNSEAWWARYSPQLWLIPVIVLAALWYVSDRRTQLIGNMLAVLMFINIFLVSGAYIGWNTLNTRQVRATLAELHQSDKVVMLYYGPLEAVGMRFEQYGIPFQWVGHLEDLPCPRELENNVFYSPLDCPSTP